VLIPEQGLCIPYAGNRSEVPHQLKIFTKRDTTTATVTKLAKDWSIIKSFAQVLRGFRAKSAAVRSRPVLQAGQAIAALHGIGPPRRLRPADALARRSSSQRTQAATSNEGCRTRHFPVRERFSCSRSSA
jgi:hypothetical protein